MQPTFRHVPPRAPRFSIQATCSILANPCSRNASRMKSKLPSFLLAQLFPAPGLVHARMQEVLVDCAQFIGQLRIEQPDDVGVAFH